MPWANSHEIAGIACSRLGASQDIGELAAALEAIAAINPEIIVEIGCDRGGTLYAWRQICERVYGITLADNSTTVGGSGEALIDYGATIHIGDSHDPKSLAWLSGQLDGAPVDALILDGDHSRAGVLADLDDYGPLVRDGGLILLHDIRVIGDARVEVPQVWSDLKRQFDGRTSEIGRNYGWGIIHALGCSQA